MYAILCRRGERIYTNIHEKALKGKKIRILGSFNTPKKFHLSRALCILK